MRRRWYISLNLDHILFLTRHTRYFSSKHDRVFVFYFCCSVWSLGLVHPCVCELFSPIMGIGIEQYRSAIGNFNNFVKCKELYLLMCIMRLLKGLLDYFGILLLFIMSNFPVTLFNLTLLLIIVWRHWIQPWSP